MQLFTLGLYCSCHSGIFSPFLWRWVFRCVYSGAVNPASLSELFFHPPPWFFQCNSAKEEIPLEEVCTLWLIWNTSWFSLELMFSRTTWRWPWGSSFVSVLEQQAYFFPAPEWQDNFKAKHFSRQCGEPQWYLMLLADGLIDTARLNSLQGGNCFRPQF